MSKFDLCSYPPLTLLLLLTVKFSWWFFSEYGDEVPLLSFLCSDCPTDLFWYYDQNETWCRFPFSLELPVSVFSRSYQYIQMPGKWEGWNDIKLGEDSYKDAFAFAIFANLTLHDAEMWWCGWLIRII